MSADVKEFELQDVNTNFPNIEMTWQERLDEAAQRGYFTDDDKICASSWHSCAVGEKHGNTKIVDTDSSLGFIPSFFSKDYRLGSDFSCYVRKDNVELAQETYDKIQKL
jgi:hypothetical protein